MITLLSNEQVNSINVKIASVHNGCTGAIPEVVKMYLITLSVPESKGVFLYMPQAQFVHHSVCSVLFLLHKILTYACQSISCNKI